MSVRVIAFLIFLANFLFGLIAYYSIPASEIRSMGAGTALFLGQSLITSFALVLLSYWVWRDGENQ